MQALLSCNLEYNILLWLSQPQISQSSLHHGVEIPGLCAMALGTETISTSATGNFSSCQAEAPPLDTKAVCVEHGVMAELSFTCDVLGKLGNG